MSVGNGIGTETSLSIRSSGSGSRRRDDPE
jgi:hypothetical protein